MAKKVETKSGTRTPKALVAGVPKPKKPVKIKDRRDRDLSEALKRLGPYPQSAPTLHELSRARLDWHTNRARIVDNWRRRDALRAATVQDRNFPTIEIGVDLTDDQKRVRRNMTRVRQSEAWRHGRLTSSQREAEVAMDIAWRCRTAGFGSLISAYSDLPAARVASPIGNADLRIEQEWLEWFRRALKKKIPIAVVLDVLTEPRTLTEIERSRKLKPGNALAIYQLGLDLWSEVQAWMRCNGVTVPEVPLTVAG